MDSVSALNRMLALVRQQLATRESAGTGSARQRKAASEGHSRRPSTGDALTLSQQIETLKRDGLLEDHALLRAAVEFILDREFGQSLRNEPEFQQMIDEVSIMLEDDANLPAAWTSLLR
jgi:hypothetical protein